MEGLDSYWRSSLFLCIIVIVPIFSTVKCRVLISANIFLILFGNHVASVVKEHGYDIVEIPVDLKLQEKKQEKKEKAQKFVEEGKEIAQKFLEDQIQKGLDYLKDEEHREKILAAGIAVAKPAFKMVKKGK